MAPIRFGHISISLPATTRVDLPSSYGEMCALQNLLPNPRIRETAAGPYLNSRLTVRTPFRVLNLI